MTPAPAIPGSGKRGGGKPTLISLFAGIGGLDLAAHWAGFETVRFVEKEPFCQKVLAKHWPGVPIDDDVFTSHPGHADVVCGGFPCQPFSVAGAQRGRDDERFLLPEMLRIVEEVKPYAVLFENVPGFPSLNDGREFKYLLGTLAEMGFDAEWGHIRASDIGAPHQRERWFLVAYTTSQRRTDARIIRSFDSGTQIAKRNETVGSAHWNKSYVGNRILVRSGRDRKTIPFTGMEGNSNGLPSRLDFVGFPAPKKQPQFSYEPTRITSKKPEDMARHKALGNAVVPQVAYPIFAALAEWFAEIEGASAAA